MVNEAREVSVGISKGNCKCYLRLYLSFSGRQVIRSFSMLWKLQSQNLDFFSEKHLTEVSSVLHAERKH